MGFRNPLTTLSADQITPGTLLGSVISTALTGKRVQIDTGGGGRVRFYTGDVDETEPGRINCSMTWIVGVPDHDHGDLILRAPELNGHQGGTVWIDGVRRDGTSARNVGIYSQLTTPTAIVSNLFLRGVQVAVGYSDVGPTDANGYVWVPHTLGEIPSAAITQALGAYSGPSIPKHALVDLPNSTSTDLRCRIIGGSPDAVLAAWSGRIAWVVMQP